MHHSLPSNPSRFIYHFLGLAPVATNIVTPLVVYYQLQNKPIAASERKLLVMQERRGLADGKIAEAFPSKVGGPDCRGNDCPIYRLRLYPTLDQYRVDVAMAEKECVSSGARGCG
jgi:hypothetical protein